MQERGTLSNRATIDYGLGVELGRYRGLKTVSHGGADAGYRSEVFWFPEQELGVAVLSNLASVNPRRIANEIATVYLGDQMQAEERTSAHAKTDYKTVDPKDLTKFVGIYPLPKIDQTLTVVTDQGKIWAAGEIRPPSELHSIGLALFYCEETNADIAFFASSEWRNVRTSHTGHRVNEGVRVAVHAAAPMLDLLPYAGIYWS